jgi:uncharacterized protein YbcI
MVTSLLSSTTGRGPVKARTTFGDNAIFVVLQGSLTRGEQSLVDHGDMDLVLDLRRRWQEIMREDMSAKIEEFTGREVVGFMSDNHLEPDLGVEVFILAPLTRNGKKEGN